MTRLACMFVLVFAPTLACVEWWRETGDAAPAIAAGAAQVWLVGLSFLFYEASKDDPR